MIDLGMVGKIRPAVIISREDPDAPRALSIAVPLTKEYRGSNYEVQMPRVPWLKLQSIANVQGINSVENRELRDRRGKFEASVVAKIKEAIRFAIDL